MLARSVQESVLTDIFSYNLHRLVILLFVGRLGAFEDLFDDLLFLTTASLVSLALY